MAFFKFRKASDEGAGAPVQTPSVESIRQRARYRLAGATVLVLIGVIGFPLLFDKQPRPIAVDTPINIPDKDKVLPLSVPADPASVAVAANTVATSAAQTSDKKPEAVRPPASEEVITETAEPPKRVVASADKAAPLTNTVAATQAPGTALAPVEKALPPVEKARPAADTAKAAEAARVQALLNGQSTTVQATDGSAATGNGRFIVQVGAFADNARAHEVRSKLERAGLKTYTHVADTKDGKRIRVRVGPFSSKAEAAKVADKIKKLNLPAVILTL